MQDIIVLVLAALIVIGASLIFTSRDVLHVAIALTAVFFINSLLFLSLGQPLLAVVQLLIMIGGVSVYLFVGVAAASYSHFKYTNFIALAVAAAAIFAVITYGAYSSGLIGSIQGVQATSQFSHAQVAASLASRYEIAALYAITLMLFLLATAAIPLLRDLKAK